MSEYERTQVERLLRQGVSTSRVARAVGVGIKLVLAVKAEPMSRAC